MKMSRKERTTIRRKNYRAWKQEQKQQSKVESVVKPIEADAPISDREPVDHIALLQELRSPDITRDERLALAQHLEDYSIELLLHPNRDDYDATEIVSEKIRTDVHDILREFGIHGSPADERLQSVLDSAPASPGHSTGPRTAAGLARSSQNARKHGLSSLTSIFVTMPGEDPNEWIQLVDDLNQEFQPASRTERILVNDMAQSHWLTQRAINLQTSHIEDPKFFALYLRYQTTHHRAYYRALKQLTTLQTSRAQSSEKTVLYPKPASDRIVINPPPTQAIIEQPSAQSGAGFPDPRRSPERSSMPTSGFSNTENCHPQAA
jgi:hypothetical protein